MKRIALSILAAATVVTALPAAASAQGYGSQGHGPRPHVSQTQPWQSINQRQAELERRINIGVRTNRLTRREATALRAEFRQIARQEQVFRRNGLTRVERAELDRRFDRLSMKIRFEVADRDRPGDGRPGDRDNHGPRRF